MNSLCYTIIIIVIFNTSLTKIHKAHYPFMNILRAIVYNVKHKEKCKNLKMKMTCSVQVEQCLYRCPISALEASQSVTDCTQQYCQLAKLAVPPVS